MEKKKFIHFCDVTLRDGSYGIMHQYTKEQVVQITKGLSQAGVTDRSGTWGWCWRLYHYIWQVFAVGRRDVPHGCGK